MLWLPVGNHLGSSIAPWGFVYPRIGSTTARIVVLNHIAQTVVEEQRGKHATHVFTYRGRPIERMNNSAWKRARQVLGITLRVHDLKHTFGRRLRAAGVSYEDRQDLLGHKSGQITTHYSAAEIQNLIDAANLVCERKKSSPLLKVVSHQMVGESRVNLA
jgi:integrase